MKINFVDANCSMAFLLNFWVKWGVAYTKLAVKVDNNGWIAFGF